MPRRKYSRGYTGPVGAGTTPHLPMTTDPITGEVRPSGLDLQRNAQAMLEDKLRLMAASASLRRENAQAIAADTLRQEQNYLKSLPTAAMRFEEQIAPGIMRRGSRQVPLSPEVLQRQYLMQQKAQIDASLLETRYTAKDKANLTKIETQTKQGWSMLQRGEITDDEYGRFLKQKQSEAMGVIPGNYPSLSPYAKGQNVGDFWDQGGVTISRKQNGETWQVDEKKSARGMQLQQEADAVKEKARIDREDRKDKNSFIDSMMKMKVVTAEGERGLNPDEMREMLEKRYPSTPMPDPEEVQHAREYLGLMRDRWGSVPTTQVPPEVQSGIQEASALVESAKKRAW